MVQGWGSGGGWAGTLGPAGHRSRNEGGSPQEWGSISPGIGEHCSWENHQCGNGGTLPRGGFMAPGIRKHCPREINHPRKGNVSPQELGCISLRGCITPGMGGALSQGDPSPPGPPLPSSQLLTDGPRRTFSAELPPGSASGIRTAPGWQQLSPSWGTGAAAGSRPGSWASPPSRGRADFSRRELFPGSDPGEGRARG